jgi:bifunctional non-homologous end joining protein LigD
MPMLAKETDEPFDDNEWIYEIKWDGYRAIAEINKGNVRLYSRNGNNFENTYPVIADQLKKIRTEAVLDGEIIVLNEKGLPEFQLLQHYDENRHRPIQYYVFDILSLKGKSTCDLPLIERKKLLEGLIPDNEVIKYSDHIIGKGKAFFNAGKKKDIEGIIAKRSESNYYPGRRTN